MSQTKDEIDQKPLEDEQDPAIEVVTPDEESPPEDEQDPPVEEELTAEAPESYEQVLPIVLRRKWNFDGQDFLPGHQIAEIRITERGVSLNFLVDAIKDKIASEVVE